MSGILQAVIRDFVTLKHGCWIGLFGTVGKSNGAQGLKLDSSDNVYISGNSNVDYPQATTLFEYDTNQTISFQKKYLPSTNYANLPYINKDTGSDIYLCGSFWNGGSEDACVTKYNSSGSIQWSRIAHDSGGFTSRSLACAVDSSTNIYAVGQVSSGTGDPAFIVKYNNSGTIQWQKRFGNTGANDAVTAYGVAVDSSGDIIICGSATASGVYGFAEIFKLSSSGTVTWQNKLYDTLNTTSIYGYGVATDTSDNIYVCGIFWNGSANTAYIAKYNSSGTIQWQRTLSGLSSVQLYALCVDTSGNVYACGAATISGIGSGFIVKYNNSGAIQWQRYLGNTRGMEFQSISVSGSKIYITGYNDPVSGTTYQITASLLTDGSLMGSYSVGGYTYNYAASSFTDAAGLLGNTSSSIAIANTSLSISSQSFSTSTTSFTSTVTQI